jgi:hypothetical protein
VEFAMTIFRFASTRCAVPRAYLKIVDHVNRLEIEELVRGRAFAMRSTLTRIIRKSLSSS